MNIYTVTAEVEALDAICLAQLGDVQFLPATLDHNPGLAGMGLLLPAGTTVILPNIPAPTQRGLVRLWGKT